MTDEIRPLQEADRRELVALLERAPAHNLYLLGNLETLGFDHDFCRFWGQVDPNGRVRGVVNLYMVGWSIFGEAEADWTGLAAVIDGHPGQADRLQDNPGGIDSILPHLQRYAAKEIHVEELMELPAGALVRPTASPTITIRRAGPDDLGQLIAFYADAEQMTRSAAGVERPLRDTRVWLGLEGERIVSSALTNAETSGFSGQGLAMIGGVYTARDRRGRGYSRAVCHALCAELQSDGKMPVLYWDTPAAGAVYRKLGFRAVGSWRSIWLARA